MRKYLIAEYCEGPFFMGWWLYERDRNDGSPNDDNRWGWLRCNCFYGGCNQYGGCAVGRVYDFCRALGQEPPQPRRSGDGFAEWFAATFPHGLVVEVAADGYTLIEAVKRRPRQVDRRIIRTVRRANASFAKACAEEDTGGRAVV